MTILAAQIRAARGLLRWTQGWLAARAGLSVVTLNMIESEQVAPRARTLDAIRRALEREGVRFIGDAESGVGVLLGPRPDAAPGPVDAAEPGDDTSGDDTFRTICAGT